MISRWSSKVILLPLYTTYVDAVPELSYQDQKLVLGMEIKYNNNWEDDAQIRGELLSPIPEPPKIDAPLSSARRRNTWICNLRESLQNAGIHGPGTPSLKVTTTDESHDD